MPLFYGNVENIQFLVSTKIYQKKTFTKQLVISFSTLNEKDHVTKMSKATLQNYSTLEEHEPEVVYRLTKALRGKGAFLSRGRGSVNSNTRVDFKLPAGSFEAAQELHSFLSTRGYCNPKPLEIRERKAANNRTRKVVYFSTYALKAFNCFNATYAKKMKQSVKLKLGHDLVDTELKTTLQTYTKFAEHDEEIRSIVVGSLLGDANADRQFNTTQIRFHMAKKHLAYMENLHANFAKKGYCNPKPLEIKTNFNKTTKKLHYTMDFNTWSLQSFNEIHTSFYRLPSLEERAVFRYKYIKDVPTNVSEMLTPLAVAHWIMGDGSFMKGSGRMKISTHSFSQEGLVRLQKALQNNFGVQTTFYNEGSSKRTGQKHYVLYFPRKSVEKLIPQVKDFFVPSMLYKLGLGEQL